MKLFFFSLVFIFINAVTFAQSPNPIRWESKIVKVDSITNLLITVNLDKGWHIFASNAGGDGLAINTEIFVTQLNAKYKKVGLINVNDSFASVNPISREMEGFGKVFYFEGQVVYTIPLNAKNIKSVNAKITYQACNDSMCLPPVDIEFKHDINFTK